MCDHFMNYYYYSSVKEINNDFFRSPSVIHNWFPRQLLSHDLLFVNIISLYHENWFKTPTSILSFDIFVAFIEKFRLWIIELFDFMFVFGWYKTVVDSTESIYKISLSFMQLHNKNNFVNLSESVGNSALRTT